MIEITECGWKWTIENEEHELIAAFGTVHVRKININELEKVND